MIGVLLVNLGTPDAPTPKAVGRYLKAFLSDRRVVALPPLLWQPLLRGLIAPLRAGRVARLYRQIWDDTRGDSPLRLITRRQAERLSDRLSVMLGPGRVRVAHAMRYGRPGIAETLDRLVAEGMDRLLFAPLYPQYAGATTGSALDALARWLPGCRHLPAVRSLPPYYADEAYVAALAESVKEVLSDIDDGGTAHILCSFHGLPQAQIDAGDPYATQCEATAAALRNALGWPEARWHLAYQSRFGPARWLEPETEATAVRLARGGVTTLVVVTPGFAADCLETLEELHGRVRQAFLAAGGRRFLRVPCLNDHPRHIAVIQHLILRELSGWL